MNERRFLLFTYVALALAVLGGLFAAWAWRSRSGSRGEDAPSTEVSPSAEPRAVTVGGRRSLRTAPRRRRTPSEAAELQLWRGDMTNRTRTALTENDLDGLESFLEFLRESDDWRGVRSVFDAMRLVPNWRSAVSEDAQDLVLDAVSEYGQSMVPELLGFLESSYEDVRADALEDLAETIEESEDEKGMCSLISMLSDTVDDAEFAERMVEHMDMMDLTHDVSNAMMHILSKGTPAFRKALSDFLLDEEYARGGDKTSLARGVGKWLSERLEEED